MFVPGNISHTPAASLHPAKTATPITDGDENLEIYLLEMLYVKLLVMAMPV